MPTLQVLTVQDRQSTVAQFDFYYISYHGTETTTRTMITLVLIAVCSSLALLYQRSRRCLRHRKFCQENNCFSAPTFPQWERILGIDLMLDNFKSWKAGQLLDRTRSRFRQVGNTYSATVAGMPSIFTIEPENIKAIFSEKFDDFDSGWLRRRAFAPSIGDVLITADGARWHQQRAMLRPAFNKQQYSDFAFYEQDIADLIKRIPGDGTTIDLAPLFHTHALTVASRLLFDEPMASLNPDFATSSSRFLDAFLQVNQGNQKRIRMGAFLPLVPRDRTYEAGCKVVHEYGDIFVQKALTYRDSWTLNDTGSDKKVPDRYIFLQEIAKDIEDRSELRNHLLGMLLVGSETTASFLTGCISLISSRPGTWTKLREEAMGLGVPSSEGLKSFTSLSYILNEGNRGQSSS